MRFCLPFAQSSRLIGARRVFQRWVDPAGPAGGRFEFSWAEQQVRALHRRRSGSCMLIPPGCALCRPPRSSLSARRFLVLTSTRCDGCSRTAAALHVIAVLVLIFEMNGALITMTTFSSNSSGRLPALHTRWSGLTVCSCPAAPAHGSVERAAFRAKALVSLPAVHNLRPDLPPDGKVVRNYSHPTSRTVRDTLELMATLRL